MECHRVRYEFKSPSFQRFSNVRSLCASHSIVTHWYQSDKLDMVDRNTVSVDRSLQAADPRLKKKKKSRSRQTLYHFQNCGTVYMDSFNTQGVSIENCGNNVPQVTCSLSFYFHSCFSSNLALSYYLDHRPRIIVNDNMRDLHSQSHADFDGMWEFAPPAIKHVEFTSAFRFTDNSDRNRQK